MAEAPVVVPNPRFDAEVRAQGDSTARLIIHSGKLLFGDTSQGPRSTMVSEFNGLIPLPDSFSFRNDALSDAVVALDLWAMNTRGYMFVTASEAKFLDDSRTPGTSWLHLGMQIACDAGSVVGYRVTAQVSPAAIVSV